MSKRIKNNTGIEKVYVGQSIDPGVYYTIQPEEEGSFRNDAFLISEILSGDAVFNDGVSDYSAIEGAARLSATDAGTMLGVPIDDTDKLDGRTLIYNLAAKKMVYLPPVVYTESFTLLGTSNSNVWESRNVPGGAGKIAEIALDNDANGSRIAGVRPVGSSLERYLILTKNSNATMFVNVDSSGNVETRTSDLAISIRLVGLI